MAALGYASDFLTSLGRNWSELLPQGRVRFQRLVFPHGIPYDRNSGFGTTTLDLIYELNRGFLASDSQNVPPMGFDWNQFMQELEEIQSFKTKSEALIAA